MESKELYRHLLGINEPWTVERVELDMTRGQVDVYVGHAKGVRFACPECGQCFVPGQIPDTRLRSGRCSTGVSPTFIITAEAITYPARRPLPCRLLLNR